MMCSCSEDTMGHGGMFGVCRARMRSAPDILCRALSCGEIQGQGRKHSRAHAGSACSNASIFMSLRAPQALKGRLHNFAFGRNLCAYQGCTTAKLNSQSLNFGLVIRAQIRPERETPQRFRTESVNST